MAQLSLINAEPQIPQRMGCATVETRPNARILTRATGFVRDYDYTLNPYMGCQFGCAYCYAAFFAPTSKLHEEWGRWVHIKTNAVSQIRRSRLLAGRKVYMSTVTDPYQPIEAKVRLTRALLEAMLDVQPRLVIQTRGPLATRDIDLFRHFSRLRVNVTVTTDSDSIRMRFEPACPSIEKRLEALTSLKNAGIKTGVCLTPLLPLDDPERFGLRLRELRADVYVAQPFKPSLGPFAASTRQTALEMAREYNWAEKEYHSAFRVLEKYLHPLYEGQPGFFPE